jgi:hypothetical protein
MRNRWCFALVLLVAGCGGRDHEAPAPAPATAKTLPASPPTAARAVSPERAGGLLWDVTAPLVRHEPKSPVRVAEYGVDGAPRTELAVFHFGEQQVSIEGQVQAWLVQIEQPDGSDTAQNAKRREFKVGPLTVNTVEVSGIYTGPVAMPAAQVTAERDWLLLGAIVSGPNGPVMFKLSGPHDGVERARPMFEQLLHTVRPE